jgi:hypothetical protein
MSAYYMALIWIQLLLACFLTPLFLIPGTWLLDRIWGGREQRKARA